MTEPFEDDVSEEDQLTDYDRAHLKLYMRLLDAEADGTDWRLAIEILFGIDPEKDAERARRIYDAHLSRARWIAASGYKHLLHLVSK
ncbi:DUF2285 domain-containing protein [Agrobacterium rhizogenes]|nr:DUF2285 domain-containing protein [Rhizobium rhizogenes]NTJ77802.1 DUF2285 domain-containing protein [Rhizobium rhizogenes]